MRTKYFKYLLYLFVFAMFIFLMFPRRKFDMHEIKKHTIPMFDSLTKKIASENQIIDSINNLLNLNKLVGATFLIDSAIKNNPKNPILYVYRGDIYAKQSMVNEALLSYNKAIELRKSVFPIALSKRSKIYFLLNETKLAISDLKVASSFNLDYLFDLAVGYEKCNEHDSANKYYKLYLMRYPNDSLVIKKLNSGKKFQ